ncbi:cell surface glycoprotein CD200 receptor 3-like [Grammomys surdaster]|uniref:cell surface glycoprotein CD200 receptor 3-like n=1 Tax=Grammomys surdaster TaxID=491861 RepID=UPI00109F678D|nr:cell surface glycoprotein CD200 receptor 3-like [Grammomys surdaster]
MHALGRTPALTLLIFFAMLVPDSSCSVKGQKQMTQDGSFPFSDCSIFCDAVDVTVEMEISTPVSVQIDTKAWLYCPSSSSQKTALIIWKITPRSWPSCRLPYRAELQQISEKICTDRKNTQASLLQQNSDLQISGEAREQDGHYSCQIATTDGIFQTRHVQVLVSSEVSGFPGKNRTAVCETIAGKPAVQIFWIPDGDCVTKDESHSNGTVSVRSTCRWSQDNGQDVFCFVSHLTGNQTLSIKQNQVFKGTTITLPSLLIILYVKLAIILLIIGFAFFQKRNYFR